MTIRAPDRHHARLPAVSLIELLVVVAVIALIAAILLPAVSHAREKGRVAYCLANLHQISAGTQMYVENDDHRQILWYWQPHPVEVVWPGSLFAPWIFGGTQGTWGMADSGSCPAQLRPLNKYLAPGAAGRASIDVYRCQSDPEFAKLFECSYDPTTAFPQSSYEQLGNSYTLNTRFYNGYSFEETGQYGFFLDPPGNLPQNINYRYPRRLTPHLLGGKASRFVLWPEQGFYTATNFSLPSVENPLAPPLSIGWHREFSRWTAARADGSANYQFYDTRFSSGTGWTIWEPK